MPCRKPFPLLQQLDQQCCHRWVILFQLIHGVPVLVDQMNRWEIRTWLSQEIQYELVEIKTMTRFHCCEITFNIVITPFTKERRITDIVAHGYLTAFSCEPEREWCFYFKYLGSFGCVVSIVCCLDKRLAPLPTYNINLLKLKSVSISCIRGKHVPFH